MRRKTSIGLVERISRNGAVKCGGAAAKLLRRPLAASLENTRPKTMRKRVIKVKKKEKRKLRR
jgi:hypothetical protein